MTLRSGLIDASRQHDTLTHNGAVTHSTSISNCVDMFFLAGASRRMSEDDIITVFERARAVDVNMAYKLLFWARDCRGGAGEKRFFQIIAKHCVKIYPNEWIQVAYFTPEYGYYKDLLKIESPNLTTLKWFETQLNEEYNPNANLVAKWFPRKGEWFTAMHKHLDMKPGDFRRMLVKMTNVIETAMCNKEWAAIEYSKVPSVAMNMYRNAFYKHDEMRFNTFNGEVIDGKEKVNASVLFPHVLFQAIQNGDNEKAVQAQWQSLPDYMADSEDRIIPVCDVSGSMWGLPMDVSVSLGLYISERNKGIFKDAFLTFSGNPTMEYVTGDTLGAKMRMISKAHWGMNTNLLATYELILNAGIKNNVPEDEMPNKMLIISDMEFDRCADKTNFEAIKDKYEASGYQFPTIVFWNVNGRLGNVPAKASDPNVGLVSGFSPAILTAILAGSGFTPGELMMTAIGGERYEQIKIV